VNAAGRAVQRQLADGDGHAARALVADAEDRLVVGGDDQLDRPARRGARSTSATRPRWSGVIHTPRARRNTWLNSRVALPTVGV
jgi:hypothetical protein